ncbi:MAG: hypothetical protein IJH64_07495 [Oscillospiraceae bacterium]|nr:hypothetical protein [Oscillospiraceae bacterium]
MEQYYLVKVTGKKWADKFQEGQVFMKALQCFGDLSKRDDSSQNTFRGDSLEGFSESFSNNKNPYAWIETPFGRKEIIPNQVGLIDVLLLREKVFCLYSLEYKNKHEGFCVPDSEMKSFGDTAVIITNPFEFLRRYCRAIIKKYDYRFWTAGKRVSYDVDFENRKYFDEFHKAPSYSWQNEFRIVLDLALGKFSRETLQEVTDYARNSFPGKIVEDMNPDSIADTLVIDVGDIHDISIAIPISDFISDHINEIGLQPPKPFEELNPPRKQYPTFFKLCATCN